MHQQRMKRGREPEQTDYENEPPTKKLKTNWTSKQVVVDIKNSSYFPQALTRAKNNWCAFKSLADKKIEKKDKQKRKENNNRTTKLLFSPQPHQETQNAPTEIEHQIEHKAIPD